MTAPDISQLELADPAPAARSAVIRAVMPSKTLRSMPSGLSCVLSRNGGSGATSTAALTRAGP